MSDSPATTPAPGLESGGLEAVTASSDALLGMAALGKTAAALALVVAIIVLCSYLVKRWGPSRGLTGGRLRVVGSTAIGNRERVVIVEVEDTWLVLGVGGGQVNKLHELAAPDEAAVPQPSPHPETEGFASRFALALKHNASQTLGKRRARSRGQP
ncbi:flagellar biosynthetic protein FliO [Litchfieldella rifensis]|uniref:Flagellar protein n=1 Tax=Litchfieldella rifensis TaxID=762643 RepID=A0ABV7LSQ6_9GAMM